MLIAHPLFTGCSLASAVVTTNATTTTMGAAAESLVGFFSDVVFVGLPKLLSSSSLSVAVVLVLYALLVNFVDHHNVYIRFWWGTCHIAVHVLAAVAISVLIDTIFEHLASYGNLGQGGLDLQWNVFQQEFAGGIQAIQLMGSWTFGAVSVAFF